MGPRATVDGMVAARFTDGCAEARGRRQSEAEEGRVVGGGHALGEGGGGWRLSSARAVLGAALAAVTRGARRGAARCARLEKEQERQRNWEEVGGPACEKKKVRGLGGN